MTYEDHPISVTEAKAKRHQDAAEWTPRDALIHVLRKIDSGEMSPDALIVTLREQKDEEYYYSWCVASPNTATSVGLLARVFHLFQRSLD